jgi:hypothetical protein
MYAERTAASSASAAELGDGETVGGVAVGLEDDVSESLSLHPASASRLPAMSRAVAGFQR